MFHLLPDFIKAKIKKKKKKQRHVGTGKGLVIDMGMGLFGMINLVLKHTDLYLYIYIYICMYLLGPIAKNLTLDHICKNRSCVNPNHLEPVSQSENSRRKNAFIR